MSLLHFNLHSIMVLCLFFCTSKANYGSMRHYLQEGAIAKKITVDQRGKGDFISVQKAIDSVSPNNKFWTHIYIKAGIYNEKIKVPIDKPFIILQGESRRTTLIHWGEAGSATRSSTFILSADNFIAIDITFKNTYNLGKPKAPRSSIQWAPAATIYADKASFYHCGFIGVQDTLTDLSGRHYFNSCYIEGAIDFIWGGGQSVYERCVINATTGILNGSAGYITAQARENPDDKSGFLFHLCSLYGTGPVYLGRAYRRYSRVVFKQTYMSDIVKPEGWSSWDYAGQENDIMYSEVSCSGPGANTAKRVKWEKNFPAKGLERLKDVNSFINVDRWIQKQPKV